MQPSRLTLSTILLLATPPLLWAANAVLGRLLKDMASPLTLNFIRWVLAFFVLLPLAHGVLRRDHPMWRHWRRYSVLGLLGVGIYNAFQYLALQTSTPLNVTLITSSTPFWMLLLGTLFFGQRATRYEMAGAVVSMLGVLLVLAQGDWRHLAALRLVPGDLYILLAVLAWSVYSWMLVGTNEPAGLREDWAAFLMAQMVFGLAWSGLFAAGEWAAGAMYMHWSGWLVAALVFIAVGPALLAFRCWGAGAQRAGPKTAAFFLNLTPLFAALLSATFLGEVPHAYHGVAFALIVGGIVLSSVRGKPAQRRQPVQ